MPRRLLYKGIHKIPEILQEPDINSIIYQLSSSQNYPKNSLGKWTRARDACLIATIYILGLRPKEACCLKFSDFNFQQSTVKIRGENNKTRKDRIIPVPKILIKIYENYFIYPRMRFWKGSKYLFPSLQNSHISPERLKFIFREKALKPLGLWQMPEKGKVPKIRVYTLRHSRASHILNKQIKEQGQPDLYAIANFLGHSDIRSTMVYLHTDREYFEYLRRQVNL